MAATYRPDYPRLTRNQWHGMHDYTLALSPTVHASLSVDEFETLKAAVRAVEELERPLTNAELDRLRADLQEVRDARL